MKNITHILNSAAIEFALEDLPDAEALKTEIDKASWRAANKAKQYLIEESGRKLKTTRSRYANAIYIYEDFMEGGIVVGVDNKDPLVDAIENGAPGFDMKPGLLKGRKIRVIPLNKGKDMRTVSAGHGSDKWMHPGWQGLHLIEVLDEELDNTIIPDELNEMFIRL